MFWFSILSIWRLLSKLGFWKIEGENFKLNNFLTTVKAQTRFFIRKSRINFRSLSSFEDFEFSRSLDRGYKKKKKHKHRHNHYYTCFCFDGFIGDGFNCTEPVQDCFKTIFRQNLWLISIKILLKSKILIS